MNPLLHTRPRPARLVAALIGIVTLFTSPFLTAQSGLMPGPYIGGHDFGARWVSTLNPCTKNDKTGYDALIYIGGSEPFAVISFAIIGADQAYFTFDTSNRVTSVHQWDVIFQGGVQKVIFMPKDERSYSATVRLILSTDTIGVPTDTVESLLTGIGVESHISFNGYDFGAIPFSGTPVIAKGMIELRATRPTTITGMYFSGTDATDFRLGDEPWPTAGYTSLPAITRPWVVPPGMVIEIPIEFNGTREGYSLASFTINGNFSGCDTATRQLSARTITDLSVSDKQKEGIRISADNTATISLSLPHSAIVTLDLYDASGTHIARRANGPMEAGTHRIAMNRDGLASGVYLYRLMIDGTVRTGRIVVVR